MSVKSFTTREKLLSSTALAPLTAGSARPAQRTDKARPDLFETRPLGPGTTRSVGSPAKRSVPAAESATAVSTATPPHVTALVASVQATLARGEPYVTSLSTLVENNLGGATTTVGRKLAQKWVKNAAQHVFTDPYRWLVELVVNAIDASSATKVSAGQFGMGFLSCLEFLGHAETQGAHIIVDTRTPEGAYRITLSGRSDDPDVRIESLGAARGTGTTMRILPNAGSFSAKTVSELTRQLALVQFHPQSAQAHVAVTPSEIVVSDSGQGITPALAVTKLLIPSGSTKGRAPVDVNAPADLPQLVQWQGKASPEHSYSLIAIAGVVVVARENKPPALDAQGRPVDVLLNMPQWTRVTLDRDEVILDSHGTSPEQAYIERVIDQTLERTCASASAEDAATLTALYTSLRAWEDTSASSYLAGRPLTRHLKAGLGARLKADERLVPVPAETYAQCAPVIAGIEHAHRFLALPPELIDFNYERAERHIPALFAPTGKLETLAYEHRLIDGKSVIFVDDAKLPKTRRGKALIASLGLRGTLFAPRSMLKGMRGADALRTRLIHAYPVGFAQLTAAKQATATSKASSSVEQLFFVTNGTREPLDDFSGGNRELIRYDASLQRRVFSKENDAALRSFWRTYCDYVLAHHDPLPVYGSPNARTAVRPLADHLYSAFYHLSDGETWDDDAIKAAIVKGLSEGPFVAPHLAGLGSVDAEALWRLITPHLAAAKRAVKEDHVDGEYDTFFPALVDKLVREHPAVFETLDAVPYIDQLFQEIFRRYAMPEKPYARLGDRTLWPLPADATADDIALAFGGLCTGLFDDSREPMFDNRPGKKRHLPGMDLVPAIADLCSNPLTVLGVHSDFAERLAPAEVAALAPLVGAQLGLQPALRGLDLLRNGAQSLALLHDVIADDRCSGYLTEQLGRLREALLHLSNEQVALPDGAVTGGYDRSDVDAIKLSTADRGSIRTLLLTWPGSEASLAKLVDMQRDHAATILSANTRATATMTGSFPSYRLDADFTPWSALAQLHAAGVASEHLVTLVDACRNPQELIYASHVVRELETKLEPSAKTSSALRAFVERLLQQRLDPHRVRAHADTIALDRKVARHSRFTAPEKLALKDFATDLASQIEGVSGVTARTHFLEHGVTTAIAKAPAFRLSQLLAAHAGNPAMEEALQRGALHEAVALALREPALASFSKVRQNAEHGSERSPIQSTLVETVQNSFDAVRAVQKKGGATNRAHGVEVSVELVAAQADQSSLALAVRDTAGMPNLATLLTDFILPDYSSKADQGGAVGVMGNGLFQLYSDAAEVAMVTRLTSDPAKAYALCVTPIREGGRIQDLEIRCADVSTHKSVAPGSTLHVRMQPQDHDGALYDGVYAQHFVRETLGAARVVGSDGAPLPLHLRTETFDTATRSLNAVDLRVAVQAKSLSRTHELSGQQVNVTNEEPLVEQPLPNGGVLRIRERTPTQRVSQLTTGGVPVMDLARFCRQERLIPDNLVQFVNVGLVLDIPLGAYTPVQSRTDLKLPETTRDALRRALLDAVFVRVFEAAGDKLEQTMQHFGSETAFLSQVAITPRDVTGDVTNAIDARAPMSLLAFMTHHHDSVVTKSFSSMVERLLQKTDGVEAGLQALSEAYWKAADAMGPRPHHCTIQSKLTEIVERVTAHIETARKNAIADLRGWVDGDNAHTRALAEKAAIPWLDKKLKRAVQNLLRTFEDAVGMLNIGSYFSSRGPEVTPEELAAARAAYVERRTSVIDRLQRLMTAIANASGNTKPVPTLGFDGAPWAEAMYVPDANHIALSTQTFGVTKLHRELDDLAKTGVIDPRSSLAKLLLVSPTSSGTLNHELHHWRVGGDEDAHAPGLTPDGVLVDFESCSTAHFREAVGEGALAAWVESLRVPEAGKQSKRSTL